MFRHHRETVAGRHVRSTKITLFALFLSTCSLSFFLAFSLLLSLFLSFSFSLACDPATSTAATAVLHYVASIASSVRETPCSQNPRGTNSALESTRSGPWVRYGGRGSRLNLQKNNIIASHPPPLHARERGGYARGQHRHDSHSQDMGGHGHRTAAGSPFTRETKYQLDQTSPQGALGLSATHA